MIQSLRTKYQSRQQHFILKCLSLSLLCVVGLSLVTSLQNDSYADEPDNAAIQYLQDKIRQYPLNHHLYFNLGNAYDGLGRYDDAIKAFKKSLEIKEDDSYTYFNLAIVYGKKHNYREAIKAYKRVLELDPKETDALFNMGVIYGKSGEHKKAIYAYQEVIKASPANEDALLNLGIEYGKAGNHNNALSIFKEALKKHPDSAPLHYNLAVTYLLSSEPGKARHEYLILKSLDSEKAELLKRELIFPVQDHRESNVRN